MEVDSRAPLRFTYSDKRWSLPSIRITEGKLLDVAARFIAERVWHPSQKLTHRKDGSVILEMTLADLGEVASWVLSFGPTAVVLAPAQLREQVAQAAVRTVARYGGEITGKETWK
jgi:predicted DNA-binding transcriptional regulator YafY